MAGIAILIDIFKRNHTPSSVHSLHSFTFISATAAASAAAASVAATKPFISRAFGEGFFPISYCDSSATAEWNDLDVLKLRSASENLVPDSLKYRTKVYPIEIRPLFSAFGLKALALTSLRSFLLFYLPLLEPRPVMEDDDFSIENTGEKSVDLVHPFQESMKHIVREVSVKTTRRTLERVAVHYTSRRMAWKLLKDVPKSAKRKAHRGMPPHLYLYGVSRTTFRGELLGVSASWFVQVAIEVYRCFFRKNGDEVEEADSKEKIRVFRKKLCRTTIKCCASLVFASIGGGIGALFHPSTGQWIGCALGDFAGPIVAVLCFEKTGLQL